MACRRQSSRRYDRDVVISVQRVGDETSNRVGGGVRPWVVDFVKEASGILIFGLAQFFMKLFERSNRPYFKNLNEATKHKMM